MYTLQSQGIEIYQCYKVSLYVDRIASGVYDFIRVPLSDQLFEVMYQMMYVLQMYLNPTAFNPEAIEAQYIEGIFTEVPVWYIQSSHT